MKSYLVILKQNNEIVTEFLSKNDFDKFYDKNNHIEHLNEDEISGMDLMKIKGDWMVAIELHPGYELV